MSAGGDMAVYFLIHGDKAHAQMLQELKPAIERLDPKDRDALIDALNRDPKGVTKTAVEKIEGNPQILNKVKDRPETIFEIMSIPRPSQLGKPVSCNFNSSATFADAMPEQMEAIQVIPAQCQKPATMSV
jgi:hypothetical protein